MALSSIATQILLDAFDHKFDTALVISGDSDLVPPIRAIRQRYPAKRIIAIFPPSRTSSELRKACDGFFQIGRANLAASIFPDEVTKPDGYVLKRPPSWGPTNAEEDALTDRRKIPEKSTKIPRRHR